MHTIIFNSQSCWLLTHDHREGLHTCSGCPLTRLCCSAKGDSTKESLNFWLLRKPQREKNLSFTRNGISLFCKTGKIFSKKWALDQKRLVPLIMFREEERKFPDPPYFLLLHPSLSVKSIQNWTPFSSWTPRLHWAEEENFVYTSDTGHFFCTSHYNVCLFAISLTHIQCNFQIFSMAFVMLQRFPGLWGLKCRSSFLSVGFFLRNSVFFHPVFFFLSPSSKTPRIV